MQIVNVSSVLSKSIKAGLLDSKYNLHDADFSKVLGFTWLNTTNSMMYVLLESINLLFLKHTRSL